MTTSRLIVTDLSLAKEITLAAIFSNTIPHESADGSNLTFGDYRSSLIHAKVILLCRISCVI
jgi:hypothetical protein